jgi:hypothetical protein
MTRHAVRKLTDDPIGAHMRRRTVSDAIPEEPWRLRHTPVDGERTVDQAAALRGRKAMARRSKVPHMSQVLRIEHLNDRAA